MENRKERNLVERLAEKLRKLQKAAEEKRQPEEKEKTPQFGGPAAQPGKEDKPQAQSLSEVAELLGEYAGQYGAFTGEILAKYARQNPGDSLILSPFSILTLLGIAASSVTGAARDEILAAVAPGMTLERLQGVLTALSRVFGGGGTLIAANAVCVQETLRDSIADGYEAMLREVFGGRLFASADIVADVNAWVAENTRGMIDRIADDSMRGMPACLMNAAAFEAEWDEPYEEDSVWDDRFTNADGTESDVQMMGSTEHIWLENADFTGFVKLYKGREFSFAALLPKEEGTDALLQALERLDLPEVLRKAQPEKVRTETPEFEDSFEENITEFCQEKGIGTLFTAAADFSPMSGAEELAVDTILHKAHIEVDRQGTRAAAVTAAMLVRGLPDMEETKEVRLDRPCVYAVVHNRTRLPVFCGVKCRI